MAATGGESKQVSIHVREDSDSELQALFDISLKGGLRPLQGCVLFVSYLRPFCVPFVPFLRSIVSFLRPFCPICVLFASFNVLFASFCVLFATFCVLFATFCALFVSCSRPFVSFFVSFLCLFVLFFRSLVSFMRLFCALFASFCVLLRPFVCFLCYFCVLLCPVSFCGYCIPSLPSICVLWLPFCVLFRPTVFASFGVLLISFLRGFLMFVCSVARFHIPVRVFSIKHNLVLSTFPAPCLTVIYKTNLLHRCEHSHKRENIALLLFFFYLQ
jgi:hypothetical protein